MGLLHREAFACRAEQPSDRAIERSSPRLDARERTNELRHAPPEFFYVFEVFYVKFFNIYFKSLIFV
jgi:hypothetical protein